MTIPENMINDYTMNNKIPVLDWYFDDKPKERIIWNDEYIDSFIERFTNKNIVENKQGKEPYLQASFMILKAIEKHEIKNKNVAIIGSQSLWIEAILLNNNNKVTTVEYNVPIVETKKITVKSYKMFAKSKKQYDCIISYSSIEHSGLGRYGDKLDPDADLKTMQEIYNHLKQDGLLFLGVPVGKDALVWNAHRIYGEIRLPILLEKFKIIEVIGEDLKTLFSMPIKKIVSQPLIILRKEL